MRLAGSPSMKSSTPPIPASASAARTEGPCRRRWEAAISAQTSRIAAPMELSRNGKTVRGQSRLRTTETKPNAAEARTAVSGTPAPVLTRPRARGASPRPTRANSMREEP